MVGVKNGGMGGETSVFVPKTNINVVFSIEIILAL